jgi:hypothetical protein
LFQEAPFWLLLGEREGPFVKGPRFGMLSETTAHVSAGGVGQVVFSQFTPVQDVFNERKTGKGAIPHCHRDGPIQFHDRRGLNSCEHVIESDNLSPIGLISLCRFGMHGGNRRLDRIGPDTLCG